jgi:hypothetical protein
MSELFRASADETRRAIPITCSMSHLKLQNLTKEQFDVPIVIIEGIRK